MKDLFQIKYKKYPIILVVIGVIICMKMGMLEVFANPPDMDEEIIRPTFEVTVTQGPDHGQVGFQWSKILYNYHYNISILKDKGTYLQVIEEVENITNLSYVTYLAPGDYCVLVESVSDREKINSGMLSFTVESYTGWQTYNEYEYYYHENEMVTGLVDFPEGKRYFYEDYDENGLYRRGALKENGWFEWNGKYYYLSEGLVQCNKWVQCRTSHGASFVTDNGEVAVGWLEYQDGHYYFTADGRPCMKWFQVNGIWYYGDPEWNGKILCDYWLEYKDDMYYLDSSGAMATGWEYIEDNWYYFGSDGSKQSGWISLNGIWYYLDPDNGCRMIEDDLYTINEKLYCFSASGAMLKGWQNINGEWFYFDSSGKGATGWIKSGTNWYYTENGCMYSGTMYIKLENRWAEFEETGEWIQYVSSPIN